MGGMWCGSCGKLWRGVGAAQPWTSSLCCGNPCWSHHNPANAELCWATQERGRDGRRFPTCSGAHIALAGQQSGEFGCLCMADTAPVLAALCESGRLLELNKRCKTNCYEQQINTVWKRLMVRQLGCRNILLSILTWAVLVFLEAYP